MEQKKIKILETTLRDGSYTINYQFNANETRYICKVLDEIGFDYIEVGPGIGFNAAPFSKFAPASSDEEYIRAAREVVKKAKIGMFFIPGIARMSDIDMAVDNQLDLIRVGTDISNHTKGFEYLERCKSKGIETAANLMKSYAVDYKQFAQTANECYKAGADSVYLVDSAGGMFPEDVRSFISETKNANPDICVGFHGHDNLGMAIANTIEAVNCGAEIVDSSIRGMGRSSGNTVTEKLLLVLKRMGYPISQDMDKLYDLSEKIILPLLEGKPESSLDLVYGYSQFHSSYIGVIQEYADLYDIEARDLIVEYTKIDKISIDKEKLEEIAKAIRVKKPKQEFNFKIGNKVLKKDEYKGQLDEIKRGLDELKHKYNHNVYFNFSKSYAGKGSSISPVLHSMDKISFGSGEVSNLEDLKFYMQELGDSLDGFLVDSRVGVFKFENEDVVLLKYNDSKLFAESICRYICSIQENKQLGGDVFLNERPEILEKVLTLQPAYDFKLSKSIEVAELLVLGNTVENLDQYFAKAKNVKWVIVTSGGVLNEDVIEKYQAINFIRIDLEKEIFNEIISQISYQSLLGDAFGKIEEKGKTYVSGGFIGQKGDIVVSSIKDRSYQYGISKGDGSIEYFEHID